MSNSGDATKKQGAYGKIKTHKESKISQMSRLDEVFSAVTLLYIKVGDVVDLTLLMCVRTASLVLLSSAWLLHSTVER